MSIKLQIEPKQKGGPGSTGKFRIDDFDVLRENFDRNAADLKAVENLAALNVTVPTLAALKAFALTADQNKVHNITILSNETDRGLITTGILYKDTFTSNLLV